MQIDKSTLCGSHYQQISGKTHQSHRRIVSQSFSGISPYKYKYKYIDTVINQDEVVNYPNGILESF